MLIGLTKDTARGDLVFVPSSGLSLIKSAIMNRRTLLQTLSAPLFLPSSGAARGTGQEAGMDTVYELRIYHVMPGKLDALLARFRDHTMKLFERHGIRNIAYWTPVDEPQKGNTLIYILQHPSRTAATENWKAFQDDPEWKSVKAKSEENGKLVEKVDSTFMSLTDFSPRLGS
jgi:NIPSNAP